MSPESLGIDRVFPGVGRIKRATGTHNASVRNKIDRMLTALYEDGRLDLLIAVRDHKITLLELFSAYQRKELDKLPTAGAALALAATWEAWAKEKECSAEHRRSLGKALGYLNAKAGARVMDVPDLLVEARKRLKGKPQTFRLLRAACQAFVKSTLKRSHGVYVAVSEVEPMKPAPKKIKHPAAVAELRAIMAKMSAPLANIAWALALTGMRPNEYWGQWSDGRLDSNAVSIAGTKTKGAVRLVPKAYPVLPPQTSYTVFRKALNKASDGQMSVYDLRRTYANWMEAAGIVRTRRRLYMGHGNQNVTDLYEWHEVLAFLAEDAAKLRAFIGQEQPGLRIAK